MTKYILPSVLMFAISISACKNGSVEASDRDNTTDAKLPMPVAYQGKTSIGKNSNMVTVMNWNKYLVDGKYDSAFALLADSVTVNMASGEVFNTTRDSVKTILRGYLSTIKTISIQYVAAVPLDVKVSDDITDEWVLSWTDEDYVMKDDSRDHNIIHEDYLLKNGKIRQVNQYARKIIAPAAIPAKTK